MERLIADDGSEAVIFQGGSHVGQNIARPRMGFYDELPDEGPMLFADAFEDIALGAFHVDFEQVDAMNIIFFNDL